MVNTGILRTVQIENLRGILRRLRAQWSKDQLAGDRAGAIATEGAIRRIRKELSEITT